MYSLRYNDSKNAQNGLGAMLDTLSTAFKPQQQQDTQAGAQPAGGSLWGNMTPYQYYKSHIDDENNWFDITKDRVYQMFDKPSTGGSLWGGFGGFGSFGGGAGGI